MKTWDDWERKKRIKANAATSAQTASDPEIVDLRRKIIAAIGESAPYVRVTEIDTLLAEFADGLVDRERDRWKKTLVGHNGIFKENRK